MSELASLLQAVGALHPRRIDLSLNRIEGLLDRLGRPQDRLAPVIHVAGTNGKGSTVAFLRFARHPADFCLLEVGLGGRFDATNVVARPLAAVIASVSHDHAEFLGDNLAGIALEKAGVLKAGAPAVVGPQDEHALSMIATEARKVGAPLFAHGEDYMAFAERGRLVYQDEDGLLDLPLPRLPGAHQIDNAGLAVATLRRAGLGLPQQAIEAGLTGVDWPARMQRLRSGPLVTLAPLGSDVWLDGGHNPSAGAAIAHAFAELEERDPRPLVLIAGMLTSKDPAGFFAPFAGLARHVMTVPVPDSAAGFDPERLAEVAMAADVPARAFPDVPTALKSLANAREKQPPRILICGSLYLAGSVLRENGPLPE